MSNVLVSEDSLTSIADAIRRKNGVQNRYTPSEMSAAIDAIPVSGIVPTGTISITENGTNIDVASYSTANVDVPNSYTANDEGKVVANGGLVSQESETFTVNGTYDTTGIGTTIVNVNGGYSIDDIAQGAPTGDIVIPGTLSIAAHAFYSRPGITSVKGLNVTSIQSYAFNSCPDLITACFPNAAIAHSYAFSGCSKLEAIVIGNVNGKTSWARSINGNQTLVVDVGSGTFGNQSFDGSSALKVLVLRGSSIMPLNNVNAFSGTPFRNGGSGGTIYIPKALYDHLGDDSSSDYKKASNWGTVDGYGTITWAQIEGSVYEHAYADGTLIHAIS